MRHYILFPLFGAVMALTLRVLASTFTAALVAMPGCTLGGVTGRL